MGQKISFTKYQSTQAQAYVTGNPSLPNLVLLHEYWGLTPGIERIADQLSLKKFQVWTPDLFDGHKPSSESAAWSNLHALDLTSIRENTLAGLFAHIKKPLHLVGLGLGASLALLAAADSQVQSVTAVYGMPPAIPKLSIPVQFITAEHDAFSSLNRAQTYAKLHGNCVVYNMPDSQAGFMVLGNAQYQEGLNRRCIDLISNFVQDTITQQNSA